MMQRQSRSPRRHAGRARIRGVGLIEVLITLIVISVGMLAILGMQLTGKQANADAVQRTTASHLASDLIERMRSNPTALSSYLTAAAIGGGSLGAPGVDCASVGNSCTPTELAATDLYLWERAMDGQAETRVVGGNTRQTGGLVNPRACVLGPALGGTGEYELVLVWRGTQEQATAALGVCGGGLDGTGLYGTNDRSRRVVRITFFVAV